MNYIENARSEIEAWENEKPGFLNQTADFLLGPAEKAAEALIPSGVLEAVGRAIEGCLSGLATQTIKTFDAETIRETVSVAAGKLSEAECPVSRQMQAADQCAREFWNYHIGYAAAEGGLTGALGFFGLAADVPMLFSILLREIQEIGTCFGYDVTTEREREYLLQILRAGFASNVKAKMAFIMSLKEFEQILIKVAWKKMAEDLAAKQLTKHSLLAALRQFAKTLGIQLTKRKALQMIPVVGALVGASLNGTLANDIGEAAYMSYRRRWMEEKLGGNPSQTNAGGLHSQGGVWVAENPTEPSSSTPAA